MWAYSINSDKSLFTNTICLVPNLVLLAWRCEWLAFLASIIVNESICAYYTFICWIDNIAFQVDTVIHRYTSLAACLAVKSVYLVKIELRRFYTIVLSKVNLSIPLYPVIYLDLILDFQLWKEHFILLTQNIPVKYDITYVYHH